MSDVSLREYLELRLEQERDLRLAEQESVAAALRLQAVEYERRLELLNNSAKVLQDAVAQNVSADKWNGFRDRYEVDQARKTERFERIERFQNKILGALALVTFVLPVLVALVVYVLTRHAVPVQTTTP